MHEHRIAPIADSNYRQRQEDEVIVDGDFGNKSGCGSQPEQIWNQEMFGLTATVQALTDQEYEGQDEAQGRQGPGNLAQPGQARIPPEERPATAQRMHLRRDAAQGKRRLPGDELLHVGPELRKVLEMKR